MKIYQSSIDAWFPSATAPNINEACKSLFFTQWEHADFWAAIEMKGFWLWAAPAPVDLGARRVHRAGELGLPVHCTNYSTQSAYVGKQVYEQF